MFRFFYKLWHSFLLQINCLWLKYKPVNFFQVFTHLFKVFEGKDWSSSEKGKELVTVGTLFYECVLFGNLCCVCVCIWYLENLGRNAIV